MTDEPIDFDEHRRSVVRKSADACSQRLEDFQTDQAALRERQDDLEKFFLHVPAEDWPAAAAKAQYLLQLFAASDAAGHPLRKALIARTLEDLARLSDRAKGRV